MNSSVPFSLIVNAEGLPKVAEAVASSKRIGLDLETTGLDPLTCRVRLVSITTDAGTWVIDLFRTGTFEPLAEALRNYRGLWVGHNIKFDIKFLLHHYGIRPTRVFDTFRASYMLWNGHKTEKGHNLYDLYKRYLRIDTDGESDLGGSDWSGNLSEAQYEYSAADSRSLLQLFEALVSLLQKAGLVQACEIEFGAIVPEAEMELRGFYLNQTKWLLLAEKNAVEAKKRREELLHKLPHPAGQLGLFGRSEWNLDSTEQVIKSFSKLGVYLPNTDKVTLAQFTHPLVREFSEYRKTQKKVTAFGKDYLQHIHPRTGRIHPSYWPLTGAGRYSCSGPNLQQLPATKDFRSCFTGEILPLSNKGDKPRPSEEQGRSVLVLADYSQIELRLVAQTTQDPILLKVYRDKEDAHQRTASLLSGTPYEQVTKEQRKEAKPINFGLMYGMGPDKLVLYALTNYGVHLTLEQAKAWHKKYFDSYTKVRQWHRKVTNEGKNTGLSRTMSGRLRYLDPETDFNEFKNTPIQGTGADGLKAALPVVSNRLLQIDASIGLVHMVHDELIVEVPSYLCTQDVLQNVKAALEQGMTGSMDRVIRMQRAREYVSIEADAAVCESWADK